MSRGFRDEDDDDEPVTFLEVRATRETDLALLCVINGRPQWIPKSQITDDSEVFEVGDGAPGKLAITGWFARKEGLSE